MEKFLTLTELYETKDIDESFVRAYDRLYDKAKERVFDKNMHLRAYLSRPRETMYDTLDFTRERIDIECVILRHMPPDQRCPQGHALQKVSVRTQINGRQKGIYLLACPLCKRFYSNMTEDIEKLECMQIPYYIVAEGD